MNSWLKELTDVTECIADGIHRARQNDDWLMFELYVIAASWHPSTLYTRDLCDVLLRHDEEVNYEDIVEALGEIRDPNAVESLEEAIWWEPRWDEYRQLAIKAAWALSQIGTPEALAILEDVSSCGSEEVREAAQLLLGRGGT